ncbi:MAG: hypothetical protein SFT93_00390 [Rickettsiaceae bacterium]|nr:hypothetical protein [Rickettsiaceae bacterium]
MGFGIRYSNRPEKQSIKSKLQIIIRSCWGFIENTRIEKKESPSK